MLHDCIVVIVVVCLCVLECRECRECPELVPWCGDCPLELTKVVLESERVALRDGIVSLCERSQQWFEQRRLESLHLIMRTLQ